MFDYRWLVLSKSAIGESVVDHSPLSRVVDGVTGDYGLGLKEFEVVPRKHQLLFMHLLLDLVARYVTSAINVLPGCGTDIRQLIRGDTDDCTIFVMQLGPLVNGIAAQFLV